MSLLADGNEELDKAYLRKISRLSPKSFGIQITIIVSCFILMLCSFIGGILWLIFK